MSTSNSECLDYMGRQLELEKQDQYVEINCDRCGDTISYCIDDNSSSQTFCTDCFDELFPDREESSDD